MPCLSESEYIVSKYEPKILLGLIFSFVVFINIDFYVLEECLIYSNTSSIENYLYELRVYKAGIFISLLLVNYLLLSVLFWMRRKYLLK